MQIPLVARQVAAWLGAILVAMLVWSLIDPGRSLLQIVLTIAVVQTVLYAGFRLQRPGAKVVGRWRHMRPGLLVWLALVLAAPVSLLLFFVYAGTDWSRYPHGDQSGAVLAMALGFGAGAACAGMQIVTASLRWNDEVVQQRSALLRMNEIAWRDITKTIPSETARTLTLLGRDGTMIRVPVDAHGLGDFLADAERLAVALHDPEARSGHGGLLSRRPLPEAE